MASDADINGAASANSSTSSSSGGNNGSSQTTAAALALQPVTFVDTVTLPPQPGWRAAAAALAAAVSEAAPRLAPLSSGVARWEVPLPAGCSAARWLRGQEALGDAHHRVYFSARHSTAPDTPKAALAEAAARGWSAVAGLGAAWLWRGPDGAPFGADQLAGVQRMLSEAQPRVRVLGGARFDARQAPAPEWRPFGSFCFLLPQVEYLEAANCALLSLTLAWDGRYPTSSSGSGGDDGGCVGEGPATAAEAAARALELLGRLAPPAPPSAPTPAPAAGDGDHTPGLEQWRAAVGDALSVLQPDAAARYRPPFGLAALDPEMAKQEFITGGQQGLDDLLEALAGGGSGSSGSADAAAAATAAAAAASATTGAGAGLALESLEEQAAAAAAGASIDGGSGSDDGGDPLIKVVLARRTAWPLARAPGAAALLEALQERDPRAYQLHLAVPGGAAFVACTPERLYARTGRHVASEAVAGTRPRGAAGDVEADFYLGLDLLRSAKDHAEFAMTRDWIRARLAALPGAEVDVEVGKSVLKLASVQHLYGRVAAALRAAPGGGAGGADAALLGALHPTPAVCGRPRGAARAWLARREGFDRGFYAGPFGWLTGQGAEFVVAIRSALLPAPAAGSGGGSSGGVQHQVGGALIVLSLSA